MKRIYTYESVFIHLKKVCYTAFLAVLLLSFGTVNAQDFAGGDGESPETAYQIETWEHLDNVRNHLTSYFILNNSLDKDTEGYDEFASETEDGWIPIAGESSGVIGIRKLLANDTSIQFDISDDSGCFSGNFNGNGQTISDLFINNLFNTGLFECLENAEVYDLTLDNVIISGLFGTGGIAGQSFMSIITNVSVNGIISGSLFTGGIVALNYEGEINGSSSSGEIAGETGVGGIAAINIGKINNSFSSIDITNEFEFDIMPQKITDEYSLEDFSSLIFPAIENGGESDLFGGYGGLVGLNAGIITNSFATGDLVIGFSEMIQNKNTAKLMVSPFDGMQNGDFVPRPDAGELQFATGGLVGVNGGLIARSYSTGTVVNSVIAAGGLVGVNASFSEILLKSMPYSHGSNAMVDYEFDFGILDSYSVSNVATVAFGGGLVGYLISGEVKNSYAAGKIEMLPSEFILKQVGEINPGYIVDEFDLSGTFGGLIGINDAVFVLKSVSSTSPIPVGIMLDDYPNVINSFWDTQTTGFDYSQGGTGKPSSQMKNIFTFTDTDTPGLNQSWNFDNLWTIDPNPFISYPYFGEGSGAPRQDPSPGLEISGDFLASRITVPSDQTTIIDDSAIFLGADTDIDITGIGSNGVFELNGSPLSIGDDPTRGEIESGMLTFNPDVSDSKIEYGYGYSFLEYTTSAGDFILYIDLAALAIPYDAQEGWFFSASPTIGQQIGDFLSTNTTAGFPGSTITSNFPSVYTLDQEAYEWVAATNTSQQMEVGKALLSYIFPENTPQEEMFHSPGPWLPLDGTFTFDEFLGFDEEQGDFGESHFLIGNPHPIGIDYCQMLLREESLANSIDIWFSEENDGHGGYVKLDCFGSAGKEFSTSFSQLNSSISYVGPLRGFWVQTLEENPSLAITEDDYVAFGEVPKNRDEFGLEPLTLALTHNDRNYANLLHVLLSSEGSLELDAYDAIRLSSKGLAKRYLSFFAMDNSGRKFATRSLPDSFTDDIHIPLAIETTEAGSYTIEWSVPADYAGINFSLRDNHTGEEVVLRNGMSYTFNLSDDETDIAADNSAGSLGAISLNKEATSVEPRFMLTASMFGNGGSDELPAAVALNQNYPNPFNPSTIIQYQLPQTSHVTLQVFDMAGRRVAQLVNEQVSAGTHTVTFDASNLSSGVYMYRLQAGGSTLTRKLTVIK